MKTQTETGIGSIVEEFVKRITEVARKEALAELRTQLVSQLGNGGTAVVAAPQPTPPAKKLRTASGKRRKIVRCPVPECGRKGAGPKKSWFCVEHFEKLSASERKAAMKLRHAKPAPAQQTEGAQA